MEDLCFTPLDLAVILAGMNIGCQEEASLLHNIWVGERSRMASPYDRDQRKLILDTLYWSHYFYDKPAIDAEFPAIQRDFSQTNRLIPAESYTNDFSDLDLFFKNVRIRTFYGNGPDYVRIKLRTLLKQYGYRRRSPQLIRYMDTCLDFYQLDTYLRGNVLCDMKDVKLDDMIIFRSKTVYKEE